MDFKYLYLYWGMSFYTKLNFINVDNKRKEGA